MPGMAFLDSLPCVGLFLQCILPGFISQEPTMLEHSLQEFPLLGITMRVLHACCYLSVFLARVYLWGTGVGSYWYLYLCSLHTFVCVVPLCVCLGVCTHVFELRQRWWEPYTAKARWWVPAGNLATLLFPPGPPWHGCFLWIPGDQLWISDEAGMQTPVEGLTIEPETHSMCSFTSVLHPLCHISKPLCHTHYLLWP